MTGIGFRGADQLEWLYLATTLPISAKVLCLIRREARRRPVSDHKREPKGWIANRIRELDRMAVETQRRTQGHVGGEGGNIPGGKMSRRC